MRTATVTIKESTGKVNGYTQPAIVNPMAPPGCICLEVDLDAVPEENLVWYDKVTQTFSKTPINP